MRSLTLTGFPAAALYVESLSMMTFCEPSIPMRTIRPPVQRAGLGDVEGAVVAAPSQRAGSSAAMTEADPSSLIRSSRAVAHFSP